MLMQTGWIQASLRSNLFATQSIIPIKKQAEFTGFKKQMTLELALKVTKIPPNPDMVTTLQWPNRHGKKLRLALLELLINIYVKLVSGVETEWGVRRKRFLATLQIICKSIELSPQKSTRNHTFTKSKGRNSAMTKLTWEKIASCTSTTTEHLCQYQVNRVETVGGVERTIFLQTDHWV